jgi:hypothetical protein
MSAQTVVRAFVAELQKDPDTAVERLSVRACG